MINPEREGWPEIITPNLAKMLMRLVVNGPEEVDQALICGVY